MIGNARPRLQVGYRLVRGEWFLIWKMALYRIPEGMDRAIYLSDLVDEAFRGWAADFVPGLYECASNKKLAKLQYEITIKISQYDLFADETDDFVLDSLFKGRRRVHEIARDSLSGKLIELVRDAELEILQDKLSEP
jgi:hypothetical protein